MKNNKLLALALAVTGVITNSTAQTGNESLGSGAGVGITTGDYNVFIGDSAGYEVTSGHYNTFIGYRAGRPMNSSYSSITSSDNTIIGAEAWGGVPLGSYTGTDNTIIGKRAGFNHTGTDVVFIGTHAGYNNNNGSDNVFIGEEAGYENTSGDDNVFLGEDAGRNNTTASDNTFVGNQSGYRNTTGYRNTFLGNNAGWDNTTGYWNTFLGDSAGLDGSTGHSNTFVGHAAGPCTEYGVHNTFVGNNAGWDNNRTNGTSGEGNYNTYMGSNTGYTNREGNFNIGIGSYADFRSTGYTGTNDNIGNVFIGYESMVDEKESIAIGYYSRVYGRGTVAIGAYSDYDYNSSDYSVGLGWTGHANNASNAIGIGREHYLETADNSIGIGAYDSITADYGMAIGYSANSSANYAAAYGYESNVAAEKSMVFGYGAHIDNVLAKNSVAIGFEATALDSNVMVLGNNSKALRLGIGTTLPNKFAAIDLAETSKGFMLNRLTNAQKTVLAGAISVSEKGLTIYDTDDAIVYTWDGTSWVSAGGAEVDGSVTNEIQDITLSGTNLTLSSGSTVDLSGINTDTQLTEAEVDGFIANNGYLTSFTEVDGSVTNEIQDITLSGTNLTLSSGSTVDLSGIDTDTQLTEAEVDGFVANNGYLTSFTEVDGSVTNEIQDISLTGNSLSIDNGSTLDLSAFMDNTDGQDLTAATLTGTMLEVEIENGTSVSVDLSPILADLEAQVANQEDRIAELEACACGGMLKVEENEDVKAVLYQNIPNPFNNTSMIKYYIPEGVTSSNLVISSSMGQIISNINITKTGYGEEYVNAEGLTPGTYYYSLYINQVLFDSKSMIVQ